MSFDHPLMDSNHPDLPKYPNHPKKYRHMINSRSTDAQIAAARELDSNYDVAEAQYKIDLAAYRDTMNKLEEDFWTKLETYYNVLTLSEAKRLTLRRLAYEYGHSAGYAEIVNYYDDLVELV